jgi:hypothetical protein
LQLHTVLLHAQHHRHFGLKPHMLCSVYQCMSAGLSSDRQPCSAFLCSFAAAAAAIAAPGDDGNYGSAATLDVLALQALSKRIHYGKFVAEAKFRCG